MPDPKEIASTAPTVFGGRLPKIDASHIHLLICGGTIENIDLDAGTASQTSGIED